MFHEVSFPLHVALGATGGPERRTQVVALASGHEVRNSLWAASRRRYNAGYGLRSLDDIHAVIAFFEGRRGRLHGFRWRDRTDFNSATPLTKPTPLDQHIGTGDGTATGFELSKLYDVTGHPFRRRIAKPAAGSVRIAVAGVEADPSTYIVDSVNGAVLFNEGHAPAEGVRVTAGFLFDVPVRFDTDFLDINLAAFSAGDIPSIPIVEIHLS